MNRICYLALAAVAAAAVPGPAGAASPSSSSSRMPKIKFSDYRLANGLRVLMSVDRAAPVVAVSVTYDVGSRNERPGRTGFAHLFEHMMFQGSQNVSRNEHMLLVEDNGGTLNGTTNQDRTNYFEALPSNQLDLALFLESDRMRALDINQATLDNQRAVVQEERRQSYDNQPYGAMRDIVLEMAYSSFAYKHSTIGSMADLNAATLDDVREFFRIYYAPNNAVLAVVGDFDEATARRKIEKYFGDIPRQPAPSPVDVTEPAATGEKRRTLSDPLARLVRYESAYRTVPGDHPDAPALSILGSILSSGRTGRLYTALIETRRAVNANAFAAPGRGPGLFTVSAMLPPDARVAAVEEAIDAEIARIQTSGVTEQEMNRARAQARSRLVAGMGGGPAGGLQTALGRATQLGQYAVFFNDPNRINTQLPRLEAVTAADVKRVANQYLTKQNRVVVIAEPEVQLDGPGGFGLKEDR